MSSNTLRGVGQEGDGDSASGQTAGRPDAGAQPVGAGQAGEPAGPRGEIHKIRSLDSTVPGTRSLDSSVPDASPSLDGRVPSLAATMMGMTAPNIPGRNAAAADNGRDKGTVQGRDVHLPVEMQRRAGVIAVPAAGAARPNDSSPSESGPSHPGAIEPVRVPHGAPETNSHGPWYDQEPADADADAYDAPRPNLIGRVAIGAAIAASLSVVLFAIVRVRAQGQAQEAADTIPQVTPPAGVAPSPGTAAAAAPSPAPSEPRPVEPPPPPPPVIDWDGTGIDVPPPTTAAPEAPRRPSTKTAGTANRAEPSSGASRPRAPVATAKPASAAPLPNNLFRPKALDDIPTTGTSTEPPAIGGAPPVNVGAPVGPAGVPTQPPAAAPIPSQFPPPAPPAGGTNDAPPSLRPKGKAYDPDSTLPLNAE